MRQSPNSFLIALCLGLVLPASLLVARSDLANRRLADITEREESIYRKLAEDPEFYSGDDLERHIRRLVNAYATYLKDYPNDVDGLILYGKLLRRLGKHERAFSSFLKADELDPNIAVVKQQIGTYLAEEHKGKAALPFYLRAVELEPETPAYHFSLGQLLHVFRGEFINGEIFTTDALEREMLKAFRTAAKLAPDDFDAQMRLGEAYYDLASPDWKAALLHWNKLRKDNAEDQLRAEILDLHRARVMGKLGRKTEAHALLKSIERNSLQNSKQQVLTELSQL